MWLVDLNYNFECYCLIELSDNNLTSELVENRKLFKPITIEEIVIFMLSGRNCAFANELNQVKIESIICRVKPFLKKSYWISSWITSVIFAFVSQQRALKFQLFFGKLV